MQASGPDHFLRWGCHSCQVVTAQVRLFFEPVKFILKGSPILHAKAPANPLNTGHHPENWSDVSMFRFSVPCIRSHKSAGRFIVNFVISLMVGDRRFPGATILGVGGSLFLPPTIPCQSRRLVQNLVMDSLSGLFWDFGSLYQRRCGVVSDALSRRRLRLRVAVLASGTSLSGISAIPTLRRRVSHAEERLRHQRFLHAGERLRNQRLSHSGKRLRDQRL